MGSFDRSHDGRPDDRILVAVGHDRNRELLVDWLDRTPGYEVSTVGTDADLPDAFDLCIVDRPALARHLRALRDHVDRGPEYVPVMLVESNPGGTPRDLSNAEQRLVDDVVGLPTPKAALSRRIESLLRARRASVRLAERKHQYQQLVDLTPEAILVVDDGRIVYANAAARTLFGDESSLVGESLSTLATAEDAHLLEQLLADGETDDSTDRFREVAFDAGDGDRILGEVAGVTVTYEGERASQVVVRDVTAERERQQRLDLFGRAIEAAAQGITIADARQKDEPLVYANPAFERMTGYPLREVLGRNCRFLQGEGTDEGTVAKVREAIDHEEPVSVELLNYRKDGTPFWNLLNIVPVRNDEGTVTHFLGLQRDVTEQKHREQRLVVLDRVLRHNLRNQMGVIRGHAERIRSGDDDPRAAATEIVAAAEELLDIAEHVRGFRGTGLPGRDQLRSIDLVATVEEVAGDLERDGEASIHLSGPEEAPVLAHHTVESGVRDLLGQARRGDPPTFGVGIDVENESVVLEVTDVGGAIPEDELSVLRRGTETALEHLQGLDLWLVRWAVEQSRGEFAVDVEADPRVIRLRFARPTGADGRDDPG